MSSPAQKHFPRIKHVRGSVVAVAGDAFSLPNVFFRNWKALRSANHRGAP
jgi:hypothetical protein